MQKKFNVLETNTNILMSDSLKDEIILDENYKFIDNKEKQSIPKFLFQIHDLIIELDIKKYNINFIKLGFNTQLLKHLLDKISVSEKFETEIAYIIKIDDFEFLREDKLIDISFTKKSITLHFLNTY